MKFEDILEKVKNEMDLSSKNWIIFTGLKWTNVVFEKGIFFTEKNLEENIKNLYNKLMKFSKIDTLVIDIVKNIEELTSIEQLQAVDLLNEWIFIGDEKTDAGSFVLPNTKEIKNIKQVIDIIKNKVNFSSKNVNTFKFKTKRIAVKN